MAAFGLVFAVIVYSAIGERRESAPPAPVERRDPATNLEIDAADWQRLSNALQQFQITADRQQGYPDGSTKQFGVTITVRNRDGKDFVVTAREARALKDQTDRQLDGDVKLVASDGFELTTQSATQSETEGIARAPGAVAFKKGRMSGSGVGMTYDQNSEILTITEQAKVTMTDEAGNTTMEFTAGTAILDRVQNLLTLDGVVHVLRGEQVIDGDHALARMSEREEFITYVELRGNARVTGGGTTLDAMSARDIDLDYSDDGQVLERVILRGDAALAMTGQNGAAGRQLVGQSLDMQLAADGSVTRAVGQDSVRLDMPGSSTASARNIRAKTLDAVGEPGAGLTGATFSDDVVYAEDARATSPGRTVRARMLRTTFVNDAVVGATFSGSVTFEEQGLKASAANVQYQPDKGTLVLAGSDAGGGPTVSDERIEITAQAINVALEGRRMTGQGDVKTTLRAPSTAAAAPRVDADEGPLRLPGLLRQDQSARVTSTSLDYHGASGKAVYSGTAVLSQGETAIRADTITIDQQSGDLIASGSARSTILLDTGTSSGEGDEIRYEDAKRIITYFTAPPVPPTAPGRGRGAAPARGGTTGTVAGGGRGAAPADAGVPPAAGRTGAPVAPVAAGAAGRGAVPTPVATRQSRMTGPQGNLRAERIEIVLAPDGNRAARIEAYTNVTMRVDAKTATGGRLTYFAEDERYVMTSAPPVPVKVVEASAKPGGRCNETIGNRLTFFKSTDTITVDGENRNLTQTSSGSSCLPAPAR